MIVPGYCLKCRRVRRVRVTHWQRGPVPVGVCYECEEAERDWRCQDCRCLNRYHEAFCYRYGAGHPTRT